MDRYRLNHPVNSVAVYRGGGGALNRKRSGFRFRGGGALIRVGGGGGYLNNSLLGGALIRGEGGGELIQGNTVYI